MENLLNFGFTQVTVNSFKKGNRYKATVWRNGSVTISLYSPNTYRLLDETTYQENDLLIKRLKNL